MIAPEHRKAEELFARGEILASDRRVDEARNLFLEAARFERLAFEGTPVDEGRARGILAISYVALLLRAGEADRARVELANLVKDRGLPDPARRELGTMLARLQPAEDRPRIDDSSRPALRQPGVDLQERRGSYRWAGVVRDSGFEIDPTPLDRSRAGSLSSSEQDDLAVYLEPLVDAAFLSLSPRDQSLLAQSYGLQVLFPTAKPKTPSRRPSAGGSPATGRQAATRLARNLEQRLKAATPSTSREADLIELGLRLVKGQLDLDH